MQNKKSIFFPILQLKDYLSKNTETKNRPFSKMEAENSNRLKLAKIKNVYQH